MIYSPIFFQYGEEFAVVLLLIHISIWNNIVYRSIKHIPKLKNWDKLHINKANIYGKNFNGKTKKKQPTYETALDPILYGERLNKKDPKKDLKTFTWIVNENFQPSIYF